MAFSGEIAPLHFNMTAYVIGRAARVSPEKTALVVVADPASPEPAEIWTFHRLEEAVLRIAAGLASLGLRRGDRILIRLDNTSAYALLFFGAIAGGFVPIPTSTHLTEPEAEFLAADSDAAAIALAAHLPATAARSSARTITADDVAHMMRHPARGSYAPTRAEDPAYLIYTSGTTSRPKGVLHAHRAAWGRRPMYRGWYGISGNDRMLHAGAFNWTYTLGTGLTDPWANGATAIVFTGEKEPAIWPRLIASQGATIFAAVPSLYRQILKYAAPRHSDLVALRHGLIAGETPPPGLIEEWEATTGHELHEALGMSEISTYISTCPDVPRRPGFIGKPQPGRHIAILPAEGGTDPLPAGAEGLLAVHRSDPGMMLGYWNRPEEEAEVFRGEWFAGGDLAKMDSDGYVAHLGRANDIMKALGYRVSPLEVEAALAAHPHVAEVACAEVQVRADISVIGAFIVARPGAPHDKEAIAAFAAERLAPYKLPREIVFVDALPRTANGKVQRAKLAQQRRG